ncbi:MAG: SDR family oxidoreductase, partial [Verrucomicrobiales bacterium]|nr:SDR family oxidoreductase [Verrucomicrobiales bacterium]
MPMELNLAGKKVIVFGAAQGIGRAIADAFAAEGCHVCYADRKSGISGIAEEQTSVCDIADYESVRKTVREFSGEGGIDHAVCAAAIGSGKFGFPFWNLEPEDWRPVLDVSLLGTVNVAHA